MRNELRIASTPLGFRSKLALVFWEDALGATTTKIPISNKRSDSRPLESATAPLPSVHLPPSRNPTSRSGNTSSELSITYPNSLSRLRTPSSKAYSPHSLLDSPPPLSPPNSALSFLYPSNLPLPTTSTDNQHETSSQCTYILTDSLIV